ncbi:DnaT-like ssDNA-binding protein [Sphingomonas sp. UBA978]|uniref:DnaT-like ssDNA-binding protein n=1 Tax=Sphingomonas sp. UBA978 TaxID=1947536 RepID=UPI0025F43FF7|nr:DnaT-like ssDNA-binding protein [Sphingomonas sp. UBA978]
MLNWPDKDPEATYRYRWNPPLDAGDKLASASVSVVSGDVSIQSQDKDDAGLTVVLTGGSVGPNLLRGVWLGVSGQGDDKFIALTVRQTESDRVVAAYGTDTGFLAWLEDHGLSLPADAPVPAVLRTRGTAYVDGYETFWTGSRSGGVMQELGWPRTGSTLNCTIAVADDVIPPPVVNAAYRAAWLEASTPGILAGPVSTPGSRVKRQKVDVIEREFFDDGAAKMGGGPAFVDSMIDGALRQFVCDSTGGAFMWSLGS